MDTTIIISYQAGTADMLKVCIESLQRHTKHEVACIVATADGDNDLYKLQEQNMFTIYEVDVDTQNANGIHGRILDKIVPDVISTPYFVTLDSDCFPVAEGWMEDLHIMLEKSRIAGVLHPWAPPPEDIPKNKIECRVRSQHNWTSTHVACQMMATEDYRILHEQGVRFAGGDDTGLLIPLKAKELGWEIDGFKPTRCPRSEALESTVIPEYNRLYCVVYGDKICHVGGFTRGKIGQPLPDSIGFDWAVQRIMADGGAEFLLEDRLSYKYAFDMEEEVVRYRLNQVFGVSSDGRSILQR